MRRYTVTVSNTSSFEVEANSEDEAHEKAVVALGRDGSPGTEAVIEERESGWEVTDVSLIEVTIDLNKPKILREEWNTLSDEDKFTAYECARLRATDAKFEEEKLRHKVREVLEEL